jgi:hypothetical protein
MWTHGEGGQLGGPDRWPRRTDYAAWRGAAARAPCFNLLMLALEPLVYMLDDPHDPHDPHDPPAGSTHAAGSGRSAARPGGSPPGAQRRR